MKRTAAVMAIASLLVASALYAARNTAMPRPEPDPTPDAVEQPVSKRPKVDVVIALDTSGSMSGLIDAARTKLWDIVNEIGKAQPAPELRVGLLTYGSSGNESDGYVVVHHDLTTNLDGIYDTLFKLRTSGGTEYVGRVVSRAVAELNWSNDPDTLRQIYVAGNESADQDRRVPVATAVRQARNKDIFVNAIYCGNGRGGDALTWRSFAAASGGMYAAIDHNHGTVALNTPFDQQLSKLSNQLNGTYLGYGRHAPSRSLLQAKQDKNAALRPSAAADRALAKASSVYRQSDWDLVDAYSSGKKVRGKDLPAPLRKLSERELKKVVEEKRSARRRIKAKIARLGQQRAAYLKKEMSKRGLSEGKGFNFAVKRALRKQGAKKALKFKK